MISYGKQSIDKSDIEAVIDVLEGDWLTQGPAVETFEDNLRSYFGSKHSCVVANGTAALHLVGIALEWSENDIIITSPLTFLATANSILYSNATPDFVDVDPKTFTLDPNLLEDKIKQYESVGKKVKAVIGVDFAGHPCDWSSLKVLSKKFEFQLINDNCHAMGSSINNDKQYAVKYADVVTQSYHPVKNITSGEGGAVLTNNSTLDEKIRRFRTHGIEKEESKLKRIGPWYYEMNDVGFNYRCTDFQCALGSNQLKKLDLFVLSRQKISSQYNSLFKNHEMLTIPHVNENIGHSYHLYPLLINFDGINISKRDFFFKMRSEGVNLQVHYIPIHLQPYYKKNFGFKFGDFPISEKIYSSEVSLPIYHDLSSKNVNKVANTILKNI